MPTVENAKQVFASFEDSAAVGDGGRKLYLWGSMFGGNHGCMWREEPMPGIRCDAGSLANALPLSIDFSDTIVGRFDFRGGVLKLTGEGAGDRRAVCSRLASGETVCIRWGGLLPAAAGKKGERRIDPKTAVVVSYGLGVQKIALGDNHECTLLESGVVRCWGEGTSGQLGYGNITTTGSSEADIANAKDVPIGGRATQIAVGRRHTCVLLDTGRVRCWGEGKAGQLGYPGVDNVGDDETPESKGDAPLP